MDEKESFYERVESFIGGKGFYIVLFLSLAVVAVSAWLLTRTASEAQEDYEAPTIGITEPDEPYRPVEAAPYEAVLPAVLDEPEAEEPVEPVVVPVSPDEETAELEAEAEAVSVPVREDEPETRAVAEAYIWPVSGAISMEYSPETLAYSKTMDDWRTHHGIDIEAQLGTRVMAITTGTVVSVEKDDLMGTVVTIEHTGGLKAVYANMAATPTVKAGDAVTMGAVIGSVGDTALSEIAEPSHLHLELYKNGAEVDPRTVLPQS